VVFGQASCTAIASGTHPRTYRSYINYLRSMPGLRSSINARLNLRGSLRTLRSLAEPRPDRHRQTSLGQSQSSAGAHHSQSALGRRDHPSSGIPPRPRQRRKRKRPRTGTVAAKIILLVSRQRLRAPNKGLSGDQGNQGQNVRSSTNRQPVGRRAHLPSPTTLP
jgi:hypothetical protein